MAYIAHEVTGVWCGEVGISDTSLFLLFVSSSSGIVFNPSAGAITDHNQSAKNKDPHFKSQLYVKDPGHRKLALILPNALSKPGERSHDRNFISSVGGIRTHNLLSYH